MFFCAITDEFMSGIIALITDFGMADYFVGAMKGVILSINPAAQIVDITHEISPQNIASAGFILRACYRNFPKKTIFAAVVDPGVGSNRKAILVETEDYFFIAPDNGLLSFVFLGFNETESFHVYELSGEQFFRRLISGTFHGRDVFAPVAAHLSNGVNPLEFGAKIKDYVCTAENKPQNFGGNEIAAEIIHIDRFGNLVTNLVKKDVPENFSLEISGKTIEKIRDYYSEAEQSEIFMIWGSAGFLEIAAFQDSAAESLKAATGQKIIVRKIKI